MLNLNQEQRTPEWYKDRLGIVTGSKVGVLMKRGRSRTEVFSATAMNYLYQLAGERMLSKQMLDDEEAFEMYIDATSVTSKAMRFGIEQEENARKMYMDLTGYDVTEVGLCHHPLIESLASSPDGIVNDGIQQGCLEIKCPSLATYATYVSEVHDGDTLLAVNPDYYYQCQCHMACTNGAFCDFVAFSPFVANPIHIVRIERDNDIICEMEKRVMEAEEIIQEKCNNLI